MENKHKQMIFNVYSLVYESAHLIFIFPELNPVRCICSAELKTLFFLSLASGAILGIIDVRKRCYMFYQK